MKHTKGKWKAGQSTPKSKFISTDGRHIPGNLICLAPHGYYDSMKNWEANAKLIAASPIMYDYILSMANAGNKAAQDILKVIE